MALALKKNETDGFPGEITAMEELKKYLDIGINLMPKELKKYVNYVLSPRVDDYHEIFRGVRYRDIPKKDFDFIFTDYTDDLLQEILDIIKQDDGAGRFLIIFDDMINSGQNFKRAGKTDLLTQIISTYRHIGNGDFEGKLSIAMAK